MRHPEIQLRSFAWCGRVGHPPVWVAKRGSAAQTTLQTTAEQILGKVTSVQTSVDSLPTTSSSPPATQQVPHNPKPVLPNGFLQFAKIQYVTGNQFFTVGRPLQLNVYYINKGQAPVHNAYTTAALSLALRGNRTQKSLDAEVLKNMEAQLPAQQDDKGSTVGVDNLLWVTPYFNTPLTQPMVDAIMRGQALL